MPWYVETNEEMFESVPFANLEIFKGLPTFQKLNIITGNPVIVVYKRLYEPIFYTDYKENYRIDRFYKHCGSVLFLDESPSCEYKLDNLVITFDFEKF